MTLPGRIGFDYYVVFDVESVGLHGDPFAVGGVVLTSTGTPEGTAFCFACDPEQVMGSKHDHDWVKENVKGLVYDCDGPEELHRKFWNLWAEWGCRSAALVADCSWTVEDKFLSSGIARDLRRSAGPYPLLDLASMLYICGRDPIQTLSRRPEELPMHNPLRDARHSARIFSELLDEMLDAQGPKSRY